MNSPRIAIVGAGPVGLTAALLLKRQGLEATVFERRDAIASLPQAHAVNTRSCEIFRALGFYDRLAAAASPSAALRAITWRESVVGPSFGALPLSGDAAQQERRRNVSPVQSLNMGQDVLGSILLDEYQRLGGTVHFGRDIAAAATRGRQALLDIHGPGGSEQREEFDYVLACDGAGSTVRAALDIEMEGPPSLARVASCYFKADLNRYFGDDLGPVHFLGGAQVCGFMISFDLKETWALMCVMPPGATREQFSSEVMHDLVRRAIGDPAIPFEMISAGHWNMSAQVAAAFRRGPFFLVGDAAHRFPPAGGLGLNTGVQDAHNLAWKIAQVAAGAADDALLDTYETERRPVALLNCAHSARNAENLMLVDQAVGAPFLSPVDLSGVACGWSPARDHGIVGNGPDAVAKRARIAEAIAYQRPHFDALRIEIGFRYGEEIAPGTALDYDELPGAVPGARLPHAWVEVEDGQISSLDLPRSEGYTLLLGSADIDVPDSLRMPLSERRVAVLRVSSQVLFEGSVRALLVRPDGHVLWSDGTVGPALLEAIDRLQRCEMPGR